MSIMVKIYRQPVEASFEAGSVKEAVALLQENEAQFAELLAIMPDDAAPAAPESDAAPAKPPRKPRGPNKNQPNPATAQAPPPAPVGAAPPPPAAPLPSGVPGTDIPGFLQRAPAAPAAPPPPPPPPAGVLAPKVIAELQRRADLSADKGDALAKWLSSIGFAIPGADFHECVSLMKMTPDAELKNIATALGIQ